MYSDYENIETEEAVAKNHLLERAEEIFDEKREAAQKHFNIEHDGGPQTFDELLERLRDEKFTWTALPESRTSKYHFNRYNPLYGVDWRVGTPDNAGYDAFLERASKAYEHLVDSIHVETPAEARKELVKFEETSFYTVH